MANQIISRALVFEAMTPKTLVKCALLALALATTHCDNSQCESLRDELTRQKLSWQDCTRDTDCVKAFGHGADCTGILSCDFAVNAAHRLTAERRVASLPEETRDCIECASPNCVSGNIALCEPATRKCILVTEILQPGQVSSSPTVPEASLGGAATSAQ